MRWVKAVLGLLVLGGFLYGASKWRTGELEVPFVPRPLSPVTVKAGTPVTLLLITPVASGGSKEGDSVRFLVAEDVHAGGGVVLGQGTVVSGKVSQSRSGSVAGTLTNRPARLVVELGALKAVDGTEIALKGNKEGSFEFTKANTKREARHVVEAIEDPDARKYAEQLYGRMLKGEKLTEAQKSEADKMLGNLVERYNLKNTSDMIGGGSRHNGVERLLQGDVKGMTGGELAVAVAAVGELADLLGGADKAVQRMFTGSNIAAPIGLEVKVTTAKEASVRPKKSQAEP